MSTLLYYLSHVEILLYLTVGEPTLIQLERPFKLATIGESKSLEYHSSKDHKTVIIKPLDESVDTRLILLTENNDVIPIRIKATKNMTKASYSLKRAKQDRIFKNVHKSSSFDVLKGTQTIKVRNKSNEKLNINGNVYRRSEILLPLGSYIEINNQQIAY